VRCDAYDVTHRDDAHRIADDAIAAASRDRQKTRQTMQAATHRA
jgi:hypothetical protein